MPADAEGFCYPAIDESCCISCGLCAKVCPYTKEDSSQGEPLAVYAVKHKNELVRENSSSGGLFTALSDEILAHNGVICGAAYDKNMVVTHHFVTDKTGRDAMRGSKYVQSNLGNAFSTVKSQLESGKTLFFTGTPCQVDGLNHYLSLSNTDTARLLTCDVICHGTPSPMLFAEYLHLLETKSRSKVINYYFREKSTGWHNSSERPVFANPNVSYDVFLTRAYRALFNSCNSMRPSCHSCRYSSLKRCSDITIGDFWGIEKSDPCFDDNRGVSLCLINTEKGRDMLASVAGSLFIHQSSTLSCMQHNLQMPTPPSPKRAAFWRDHKKRGLEYVLKKYAGYGIRGNIRFYVVAIARRMGIVPLLKNILHKIAH